ncbi:MAG: TonB family protein, partial [Pseudomonadota bacterium]
LLWLDCFFNTLGFECLGGPVQTDSSGRSVEPLQTASTETESAVRPTEALEPERIEEAIEPEQTAAVDTLLRSSPPPAIDPVETPDMQRPEAFAAVEPENVVGPASAPSPPETSTPVAPRSASTAVAIQSFDLPQADVALPATTEATPVSPITPITPTVSDPAQERSAPTELSTPVETPVQENQSAAVSPTAVETAVEVAQPIGTTDAIEALDLPTVPQPIDTGALRPEALAARQRVVEQERERRRQQQASRPTPQRQAAQPRRNQQANQARSGNANQNARRGDANQPRNNNRAQSAGRSTTQAAPSPSRAEISNYPGQVFRKIQRTRQPRVRGRGTARVRFSISSNGGLASARISSSSGSAQVDQAALDHVRRAAPFPRPPRGAQTSFVVPLQFR